MENDSATSHCVDVAAKIILAPVGGYQCRSDNLDVRMRHSELVKAVVSFSAWNKRLSGFSRRDECSLLTSLLSSPGAVVARKPPSQDHESWRRLQEDLETRLSFQWVLTKKPAAYRVGMVAARYMCDPQQLSYRAKGYFEAARSLGISVTVLDKTGHWLEDEKYRHLRERFIAVDLDTIEELPQRIAESVRSSCLDGIFTFTDELIVATAQAAEILGLPTESAKAMELAVHKQELRQVVNNTNIQSMFLARADNLHHPDTAKEVEALHYPLIVKPAYGRASAGVMKVANASCLPEALRLLAEGGLANDGILLETFVDGPELDCNFVLHGGKLLFFEATDDFPSAGDSGDATLSDNFYETVMVSNSGLPSEEIEILRRTLHRSLLQLGFGWGVFHLEGRMHNSSMQYRDAEGNGELDLVVVSSTDSHTTTAPARQPNAFLIEANPRPPGIGGGWATQYTYGVDYHALHLLRAVGDAERFKSLSKPFSFSDRYGGGGGAQYWTAHCLIPIHRENITVPHNFLDRLYQELPHISPYVSRAEICVKPGTIVSPSCGVGLFGFILLFSRSSREHLLNMYYSIPSIAKKILDEEK